MSTKQNVILGLDPGTNITGYALIDLDANLIDYGTIKPFGKLPKKLHLLHEAIDSFLQKFNICAIGIETQFVGKNPRAAITLGMARGLVLALSEKHSVPIFEYAPTKIKVAICKTGSAKKQHVQKMVELLYKIQNVPEDAADAIAIARCHLHTNQKIATI